MRTLLLILLTCCCLPLRSVLAQEAGLDKPQGNPKELVNSIGMKLVLIPKGTFTMGSPEAGLSEVEVEHQVTISRDYYLGVYEVTQEQYEKVMGTNPSHFQQLKNPVEQVSCEDAVEFCKRLSELPEEKAAGRVYRLPTEAEWEYACRAGTTTKFSFGDDVGELKEYAWFKLNSQAKTHPVGQKQPNAWGLYDMHGNVWEWCADWVEPYPEEAVTDPVGPAEGVGRVSRGGTTTGGAASCGSSFRSGTSPASSPHDRGFRLALSSPSGIPQSAEPGPDE